MGPIPLSLGTAVCCGAALMALRSMYLRIARGKRSRLSGLGE
jgi:hypothetical protein